jgi:serine/threonine protein kinase
MSYEFSSGIRLQIGQVIQDPVSSFEYVVDEVLESGANAFAARATRRKRASEGGTAGDKVFLKKYKSPGGSSSWFDGFVDYQQEIRQRLQNHPHTKSRMVEILKFFQRGSGGDTRRRAYYQLFAWEGQANNLRHFIDLRASITEENDAIERFQIACDFLAGLAAIHDCGVIHSDLKPENLMLNADSKGIWKLKFVDFDFSLLNKKEAPWINPKRSEDKMGYLGTERYLSPEHLQGKRPTEASDIFTGGLILSELLIGKHPVGEDKELYNRRVLGGQFGKVRLPDAVRAVVKDPDGLDKAINHMLSFEAGSRPSTSKVAELFEESRKFSIVPTANEGDPSKGDQDSDDDDTEADSEDSALEKAGEEILKRLARSKASPIVIESPEAKADVYSGRGIEDKRDFRRLFLFAGMLIGVSFLIWKAFPTKPIGESVANRGQQQPRQASTPLGNAAAVAQKKEPTLIPKNIEPENLIAVGTYVKVNFNLITYDRRDDVLFRTPRRTLSDGDYFPENQPITSNATHFRLFAKHLERINLDWGINRQPSGNYEHVFRARESLQGVDYTRNDPSQNPNLLFSGALGSGGEKGYIGSLQSPGIGLEPFVNDIHLSLEEDNKPESYRISVYLGNQFIQNQFSEGPSGLLQERLFLLEEKALHLLWGSHFVLWVRSISDSNIKVRLNEDDEAVNLSDLSSEAKNIVEVREDSSLQ